MPADYCHSRHSADLCDPHFRALFTPSLAPSCIHKRRSQTIRDQLNDRNQIFMPEHPARRWWAGGGACAALRQRLPAACPRRGDAIHGVGEKQAGWERMFAAAGTLSGVVVWHYLLTLLIYWLLCLCTAKYQVFLLLNTRAAVCSVA